MHAQHTHAHTYTQQLRIGNCLKSVVPVLGWVTDLLLNGSLHLRVSSLVQSKAREQVVNQRHEQRLIFVHLSDDPNYSSVSNLHNCKQATKLTNSTVWKAPFHKCNNQNFKLTPKRNFTHKSNFKFTDLLHLCSWNKNKVTELDKKKIKKNFF